MRVAVIGAGAIGAALAAALTRHGCEVTIFEQRSPGSGTSTVSFAWVNAHDKHPRTYHDLSVAAIAAHDALQSEDRSGRRWYHQTGSLEWAGDEESAGDLDARVRRLAIRGYRARWVDSDAAGALEPSLLLPASVKRVAYFAGEGYVLAQAFISRLLAEAESRGALLRAPARVEAIEVSPAGASVHVSGEPVQHADSVAVCAGPWTSGLLAQSGYDIPLIEPIKTRSDSVGYLGWTTPTQAHLGRIVLSPVLNLRPDRAGRLVLQAPDLDASADPDDSPTTDGAVARELTSRLRAVLVGTGDATLEALCLGRRVLPLDRLPVCGRLDEAGHVYAIATHSGITLAPLLGELCAREIATGTTMDELDPFRPGRFAHGPAY